MLLKALVYLRIHQYARRSALAVAAAWGVGSAAIAQETDFEIGFRPMILGSRGEPANDMLGGGLVAGWRWRGAQDRCPLADRCERHAELSLLEPVDRRG